MSNVLNGHGYERCCCRKQISSLHFTPFNCYSSVVLSFVASSIASSKSTLKTIFSPLDSECLACVCASVCCWVCVCVCVKLMRKLLNEGLCVYVISKVHCALGWVWVYILLTSLLLYCVLWAHVGCKHLTNTLLHYID